MASRGLMAQGCDLDMGTLQLAGSIKLSLAAMAPTNHDHPGRRLDIMAPNGIEVLSRVLQYSDRAFSRSTAT